MPMQRDMIVLPLVKQPMPKVGKPMLMVKVLIQKVFVQKQTVLLPMRKEITQMQ